MEEQVLALEGRAGAVPLATAGPLSRMLAAAGARRVTPVDQP